MSSFSYFRAALAAFLTTLTVSSLAAPALAEVPVDAPPTRNIGVYGDSLGEGVGTGLYVVVKKHPGDHAFRYAKVGAGLTRGDFKTWLPEMAASLDNDHIGLAVVMFGANDQQSIRDDNHKGYLFQTEGWKRVYVSRIDAMFREFAKRKVPVVWLGLPILRKDELNGGAAYLNAILADEVKRDGGLFVPLVDSFKGADGGFASHLPNAEGHLEQVRTEDGIHFTEYGYELIAQKVYEAMPNAVPPVLPPDVANPEIVNGDAPPPKPALGATPEKAPEKAEDKPTEKTSEPGP